MNPDESFQAGIPPREIRSHFIEAAVRAGVIRPSDPIDQVQVDFATEIVTLCAGLTEGLEHASSNDCCCKPAVASLT